MIRNKLLEIPKIQDEKERETMRRREEGSLFSDEGNIKEARWKSLKGRGPDPMEME